MRDLTPRKTMETVKPYAEEYSRGLNLMDNTNLWGPNPAIARGLAAVFPEQLWKYPSLTSEPLREALGATFDVPPGCVVTGNGSNELIDLIIRAFVNPGEALAYHPPTFSMVPIFGGLHGAALAPVPLLPGWRLDVDGLVNARAKVTFVCTPNNPTGNAFPRTDVERVIRESRGVVVVDEAYEEFSGGSLLPDLHRYDNLVVLRTFSKAHGLAGLRVGYAVASPFLAEQISKVRGPFRLNSVSEGVATLALQETGWLKWVVDQVRGERPKLAAALAARGFEVFPSDANFLFVRPPVNAAALARVLAERGVIVREFGGDLAPYLRITVCPAPIRERFLETLDECLKEGVSP